MGKERDVVLVGDQSAPLVAVEAAFNKGRYLFRCGQRVTVAELLKELPKLIGPSYSGYKLIGKGVRLSNKARFSDLVKKQQVFKVRVLFEKRTSFDMFGLRTYMWQLFLLAAAAQAAIAVTLGPEFTRKLLKMQLTPSPETFREQVKAWTADDLEKFKNHFFVDLFLYPTLYTLFCISWLAFEVERRGLDGTLYFPSLSKIFILGGACDVIENTIHCLNLEDFEGTPNAAITVASTSAILKWVIMLSGMVSLLAASLLRTCPPRAKPKTKIK